MKSKKIYLIRHGQTDYNLQGIVQGSGIDASLNETGRSQSQAFFNRYRKVAFDKVYTSALKRSIESVRNFLEVGLPHEILPGLNEINWGYREGIDITPEEDAYYNRVIMAWQQGRTTLRIEGGESPQDVYDRQQKALKYIMSKEDEKSILICMHGRAMRILLCQMLRYPLYCMDRFEHSNLGLYELTFTGSMFTVDKFNNVDHLAGVIQK